MTTHHPHRDKFHQYANTKLLQVVMAFELQRRLAQDGNVNLTVTPVTPGFVATSIGKSDREAGGRNPFSLMQDPDEGAQTTLHALFAPDMKAATGFFLQPYYSPKHRQDPWFGGFLGVIGPFELLGQKFTWGLYKWLAHPNAHRLDFAKRLWDASAETVGV